MGMVVPFERHCDVSATNLKPKTVRSASKPRRSKASETVKKYSGGIAPLAFQLETAGIVTPVKAATAAVPPSSSITRAAEAIMSSFSSEILNVSSVHDLPASSSQAVNYADNMAAVPKRKEKTPFAEEGMRLAGLREVLMPGKPAYRFAKTVKCTKSYWSGLEAGEFRISLNKACELYTAWAVSLDYVYFGRVDCLPADLRAKLAHKRG